MRGFFSDEKHEPRLSRRTSSLPTIAIDSAWAARCLKGSRPVRALLGGSHRALGVALPLLAAIHSRKSSTTVHTVCLCPKPFHAPRYQYYVQQCVCVCCTFLFNYGGWPFCFRHMMMKKRGQGVWRPRGREAGRVGARGAAGQSRPAPQVQCFFFLRFLGRARIVPLTKTKLNKYTRWASTCAGSFSLALFPYVACFGIQ